METAADAGHLIQPQRTGYAIPMPPMRWRQGAEIVEVQDNLGHSSVAITAIYTHASRKSAVEKLMAFAELSNLIHIDGRPEVGAFVLLGDETV